MRAAQDDVENGASLRTAAARYDVSLTSLSQRLNGNLKRGTQGHCQGLSKEEEAGLADFLITMARRGLPITRKGVSSLVLTIAKEKGSHSFQDKGPSNKWFARFHKENPNISLRKSEGVSSTRTKASSKELIQTYLQMVKDLIEENDITPDRIWNFDETATTQASSPRVYAEKGARAVLSPATPTFTCTMIWAVSAEG